MLKPEIHPPGWYLSEWGCWLPSSFAPRTFDFEYGDLPADLRPLPYPVIFAGAPRGVDTRVKAYIDEEKIGLTKSNLADLREMTTQIPFERSMFALARLAAKVYGASADGERHLEIASEFFANTNILHDIRRAIAQEDHLVVFSEQLIYLLMRLVIEFSPERGLTEEATLDESNMFLRALLATSGVTGDQAREALDDANPESWLGVLVQHGEFSATSDFILDRAREMKLLADAMQLRTDRPGEFVDMEKLHLEATGLTSREQSRLGLAIAALTHAFDDGPDAGGGSYLSPTRLDAAINLAGLSKSRDRAISAICSTRREFNEVFASFDDQTSQIDSLLWETRHWKTKPLLLLADGGAILLSPRFLRAWLTDGMYHRPVTAAFRKDQKLSKKITRTYGPIYEKHCVGLVAEAVDAQGVNASVSGDLPYERGNAGRTPDIMIDFGTDLVLIEVTRSSLTAKTLVTGDLAQTMSDLRRKLVGKINELGRNAKRVLAGDAEQPRDPDRIRRVWPIVVSGALPLQTPNLEMLIDRESTDLERGGRMQPLTLLDPADFESLVGIMEQGEHLIDLLAKKTAEPFRAYDLRWWLANDVRAPKSVGRPRSMVNQVDHDWIDFIETARPHLTGRADRSTDEILRHLKTGADSRGVRGVRESGEVTN